MRYIEAFYEMDRLYGGPEEGGWWYDAGTLARLHRICGTVTAAVAIMNRANRLLGHIQRGYRPISSVAYDGGRFAACVFVNIAPPHFPVEKPVYE